MRNILKTLAVATLALMLAFGWPKPAQAVTVVTSSESGALFNAVDEMSASITVSAGATLTTFVSGTYAIANIIYLQREVGSPGSGAWENVTRVTGASTTANARVVTTWTTGPGTEAYRLIMTATGTGDVVAYLTDKNVVAAGIETYKSNLSQIVFFDDFLGENNDDSLTVVNPSLYKATQGDDTAGTIAAIASGVQEGGMSLGPSGTDLLGSAVCVSALSVANFGAIASDGHMVFEVRLQAAQTDGYTYMTWQGQECTTSGSIDMLIDFDGAGAFSQVDGTNVDMAGIAVADEAVDTDDWQAFSSLIDVEGANALEVPLGVQISAAVYDVLRVEIDTVGNAYFYVNGALLHAEALAVSTSQRLIPAVVTAESAANGDTVTLQLDYWFVVTGRPAS